MKKFWELTAACKVVLIHGSQERRGVLGIGLQDASGFNSDLWLRAQKPSEALVEDTRTHL